MLHFCYRLSYSFATTQRYAIKKLNYLIEAPPTRPITAFNLFVQKKTLGKKGINATKTMKEAAESWKSLSADEKSEFSKNAASFSPNYGQERDAYIEKYVTPFKHISGHNLFMSHLYKDKVVSIPKEGPITQMGKIVGEKIKNAPSQEIEKYKKEAEKIVSEREKQLEKFKFPNRKYNSQAGFTRDHPKLYQEQRARAYKKYLLDWEFQVEEWLKKNKIELPISDFKRMYNRELKKTRSKRKEAKQEGKEEGKVEIKEEVKAKPKKVAKVAKSAKK